MATQQVSYRLNESMRIVLKGYGRIVVTGWDRPEVTFEFDKYNQKVEQGSRDFVITSLDSCRISLPLNANLYIEKALSSVDISQFSGNLEIRSVGGHLNLIDVHHLTAEKIRGSLNFNKLKGDFKVNRVYGSCYGDDFSGSLHLARIDGKLEVSHFDGQLTAQAAGDCKIGIRQAHASTLMIKSNSRITAYVPPHFQADYKLSSSSEKIMLELDGATQTIRARNFESSDGTGTNKLTLTANGRLEVKTRTDFVAKSMPAMADDSSSTLGEAVSSLIASGVGPLKQRILEEVADSLGSLQTARRPHRHQPPVTRSPGVSAEERMMVLQMVQQGKISAEEAEQLLATLEKVAA